MAFDEVRLPLRLAFGSTGGVERRTRIDVLASGHERRTAVWACGRRRYLIGATLRSLDDMAELTAFFEARLGPLTGFRFRDFADYRSCVPSGQVSALDQVLGVGDGDLRRFGLVKHYGAVVRDIRKPVAGSVVMAVDGQPLSPGDFAVDAATGEATLVEAPAAGATVTAGFLFDTPVRFAADRIEVTLEGATSGRMIAMPLIETRV